MKNVDQGTKEVQVPLFFSNPPKKEIKGKGRKGKEKKRKEKEKEKKRKLTR